MCSYVSHAFFMKIVVYKCRNADVYIFEVCLITYSK